MELVIMAAGMGSRFGGLKQLEPIDKNGNFIIDYSIFDAIRSGFDRVVFIIKEENFELFRETVGKRVEKYIETTYVFQNNDNVPSEFKIPKSRVKPLGTGHAILCAKGVIHSDFAVINADDFYGYSAIKVAADFLKKNKDPNKYALIGYKAINTFCNSGSVKRGVCFRNGNDLEKITESLLELNSGKSIVATPLTIREGDSFDIEPNTTVSMNLFAFSNKFLDYLDAYFLDFLNDNRDKLDTAEFFLPTTVTKLIKEGRVKVQVIDTNAVWYGMTYPEDKKMVEDSIKAEVSKKNYPPKLWKTK